MGLLAVLSVLRLLAVLRGLPVLRLLAVLGRLPVLRRLPVLGAVSGLRAWLSAVSGLGAGLLPARLGAWLRAVAGLRARLGAVLGRLLLTVVRTLPWRRAVRRGLGFVGHVGKCEACRL
ncbi:hypothetical protein GCM10022419_132210 [Nonomuraea rosea]|uniref:Secreted protein n=1 Tax=Nonomuraea rosea TaxID=638574 RepID=A0ABP7A3C8_9ACTN